MTTGQRFEKGRWGSSLREETELWQVFCDHSHHMYTSFLGVVFEELSVGLQR